MEPEFLREEHSPKWGTTGKHTKWGRGQEGTRMRGMKGFPGQNYVGHSSSPVITNGHPLSWVVMHDHQLSQVVLDDNW